MKKYLKVELGSRGEVEGVEVVKGNLILIFILILKIKIIN